MQFVKTNLKAAKSSISSGNYEEAQYYSEAVLENDPENYNALLFLGKSCEVLGDAKRAFESYDKATKIKPLDRLAWKGLLLLHKEQHDVKKYLDALEGIVKAFEEDDDIQSASDALRNAIKFINSKGDEEARKRFLELQLPGSAIFDFLEGRMPPVALTLERIIKLISKQESEIINKTISKNKFKIGQGGTSTNSTMYQIYKESKLPEYFQQLINITRDDDQRREMESRLLKYLFNLLKVSPKAEKTPLMKQIREMASGMVVVGSPEPLAWEIEIEWKDAKEFKDLDYDVITHYIKAFPTQGLSKVLQGFLHSEISPFASPDSNNNTNGGSTGGTKVVDEENNEEGEEDVENVASGKSWTHADVLEMISDGYESEKDSILSYRILSSLYLRTQEYESAADISKCGLETVKRLLESTQKDYFNAKNHLSVILGSAYIYYQAPKNFDAAISAFDYALKRNPQNVPAIIGKGLIFIQQGELDNAEELLGSVHAKYPDNLQALFELSWCKILKSKHEEGRKGLMECLGNVTGADPQSYDYRAQIWWRIGSSYWNTREENFEENTSEAFNSFVKTLNENPTYAPAYTSLGFFYSDAAGDVSRGTKCFYRAFELDSGEIEAGKRLAKEFAENSEWSLVEVIANRVIESERLRTFANKEPTWPHRALGIVGLNHRDYSKAVQHFQAAIRLAPKDANSWVGLGEAYSNSGRYVAASKAFNRARLLEPSNWIAEFQLGIVKKDIKLYDEAVDVFNGILEDRPHEVGVKLALIDTYLLSAGSNLVNEFYSIAVNNAKQCIKISLETLQEGKNTQDLWKAVGGACEIFLSVQSQVDKAPFEDMLALINTGNELSNENDSWKREPIEYAEGMEKETILEVCLSAFKFSQALSREDNASRALGWYNLGLAQLKAYTTWDDKKDISYLKDAVESFKRAIQLEPKNSRIWNAYGIASAPLNPKVSQHCFIRSLSFDYKTPKSWANLAALYLSNGDLDLSNETLERTRSLDPEYVPAWIGQGIIESTKGNQEEANNIFEHSFLISKGYDKLAKLLYGMSVFERTHHEKSLIKGYNEELDSGILALEKYLMLSPKSDSALTDEGFLLERDGNFEYGLEFMNRHCAILEAEYEKNETRDSLIKYSKAKSSLARLSLGAKHFDKAIEHAEFSIEIITEAEAEIFLKKSLLSATLTAGLGYYFIGEFDKSIDYFRQALEQSEEDQDVIVLLAQVLWPQGGEEEKQVALDQLYTSVDSKGASLKITLLLGVIGLVDDPDIIEAAEDELEGLPLSVLEKDRENSVQEVLSTVKNSIAPWQRAAFLWPSNYSIWKHVDSKVALQLAVSGNHGVSLEEISNAYTAAEHTIESSQRAIFFAPWNVNAWKHLKNTVKCL